MGEGGEKHEDTFPTLTQNSVFSTPTSASPPLTAIFPPLTLTLLRGYKFPLSLIVFRVEPNLSLLLPNPIVVVPVPIAMALNTVLTIP